jgi:hypothetical protein
MSVILFPMEGEIPGPWTLTCEAGCDFVSRLVPVVGPLFQARRPLSGPCLAAGWPNGPAVHHHSLLASLAARQTRLGSRSEIFRSPFKPTPVSSLHFVQLESG